MITKRIIFIIVIFIMTNNCLFSQMRKNGKLVNIKNATPQMIVNALAGEYQEKGYRSNSSIKFDKQGNFKLLYVYDKPDEYSKLIGATIPGMYYKRIVSGKLSLFDAGFTRYNNIGNVQPKNKYGEPVTDNLYVRYYIVLNGTDESGNSHTMCGQVYQRFDDQYMYGWVVSFTRDVPNCGCSCESGDSKNREVTLPYIEIR